MERIQINPYRGLYSPQRGFKLKPIIYIYFQKYIYIQVPSFEGIYIYFRTYRDLGCGKRVLVQKRVILQVDISSISGFTDIGETDILTASLVQYF